MGLFNWWTFEEDVLLRLARIEAAVTKGNREDKERDMALQDKINEIKAEAVRNSDAVAAVKGVLDAFLAAVEAAKDDEAELDEVITQFKANTQALSDAVVANTPQG